MRHTSNVSCELLTKFSPFVELFLGHNGKVIHRYINLGLAEIFDEFVSWLFRNTKYGVDDPHIALGSLYNRQMRIDTIHLCN